MTEAEAHHADVFTCDCGGFMFAVLMCSECNNEEIVKQDAVDEATE